MRFSGSTNETTNETFCDCFDVMACTAARMCMKQQQRQENDEKYGGVETETSRPARRLSRTY
jgi:hypothetical protein